MPVENEESTFVVPETFETSVEVTEAIKEVYYFTEFEEKFLNALREGLPPKSKTYDKI